MHGCLSVEIAGLRMNGKRKKKKKDSGCPYQELSEFHQNMTKFHIDLNNILFNEVTNLNLKLQ